jgi:hypothetical protein
MQAQPKQSWKSPRFVEVRMSAEIGSYQDELEERRQVPPPVTQVSKR